MSNESNVLTKQECKKVGELLSAYPNSVLGQDRDVLIFFGYPEYWVLTNDGASFRCAIHTPIIDSWEYYEDFAKSISSDVTVKNKHEWCSEVEKYLNNLKENIDKAMPSIFPNQLVRDAIEAKRTQFQYKQNTTLYYRQGDPVEGLVQAIEFTIPVNHPYLQKLLGKDKLASQSTTSASSVISRSSPIHAANHSKKTQTENQSLLDPDQTESNTSCSPCCIL